jgi:hypothetical protein
VNTCAAIAADHAFASCEAMVRALNAGGLAALARHMCPRTPAHS